MEEYKYVVVLAGLTITVVLIITSIYMLYKALKADNKPIQFKRITIPKSDLDYLKDHAFNARLLASIYKVPDELLQYADRHITSPMRSELEVLQTDLDAAVKQEEYERAAELRDKINIIKNTK
jgi:hypothetical protein